MPKYPQKGHSKLRNRITFKTLFWEDICTKFRWRGSRTHQGQGQIWEGLNYMLQPRKGLGNAGETRNNPRSPERQGTGQIAAFCQTADLVGPPESNPEPTRLNTRHGWYLCTWA
jgi:hypothetical protein